MPPIEELKSQAADGNLTRIAEGKTKEIYGIKGSDDLVLIRSKNQLTAFNAARKDELEGKGAIACRTTTNVFQYLQALGMETHFVAGISETDFVARRCEMIPIEWVVRRVATGSFLKRNPGVPQGFRFNNLKLETFFKDDENDDPQYSDEQILTSNFVVNGLKIGREEIAVLKRQTSTIFLVLEKAWALSDCQLIDMKVEFGVAADGKLVLADVIDNDAWRVWPGGDKRLQLDKQFYRDMTEVTSEALQALVKNYQKVAELSGDWVREKRCRALVIMGSAADRGFCEKIAENLKKLAVTPVLRVCSAHKATSEVLDLVGEYEGDGVPTVVIAVAGRSNGLGPVIAGNSTLPVINAPPGGPEWIGQDIWSSLHTPSGLGCTTALGADEAALAAAKILAPHDHMVYGTVLCTQLRNFCTIYKGDKQLLE